MNVRRVIKLINNERTNVKHVMTKACDATSYDVCTEKNYDNAHCTVNSYDACSKDYAACFNNGYDYCTTFRDTDLCSNSRDFD